MKTEEILARIYKERVIVILREKDPATCLAKAEALREGGLSVLEVTWTTPGAAGVVRDLARRGTSLLGAGSILTPAQAREAVDAGALFLVAPVFTAGVAAFAKERGLPYVAGALTPQEIHAAWQAGSRPVKVFPISAVGGPSYVKDVRAPMPFLEICATGGITPDNFRSYLDAGASVVGMGGALTASKDPKVLSELAAKVAQAARA